MAFYKLVGAHPVKKILPAVPDRKHHVRIAIVYGPQDLVRNEAGHLVHQTGPLPEHFLKSVRVLRLNVKAISNSYHARVSPTSEAPFVGLRVISWIEFLLTACDPLNHTKDHEKQNR